MYFVMKPVQLSAIDTAAEKCISSIAREYGDHWKTTGVLI